MVPIMIVLICIAWRILKRRKKEEKEERDFLTIRPLDPDESMKINSDDDSIPYKKDVSEDSPLPTDPVKVSDNVESEGVPEPPYNYGQPYDPRQARQYGGETEIN